MEKITSFTIQRSKNLRGRWWFSVRNCWVRETWSRRIV